MPRRRILLLLVTGLLAAGPFAGAQPIDREHLDIGAYGRFSHILDGQGIYDNLLSSYDYGIYGLSLDYSTRPEDPQGAWYNRAWNYPVFSLGLSYARQGSLAFKHDSRLGDILNLYGSARFDFVRTSRFRFGPLVELGLAFTGERFEIGRNPFNLYVGSRLFALIGAGLQAGWLITPHWELQAGAYLTHHSNGMLRAPNLGINEMAFGAGLRYHLSETAWVPGRQLPKPEQPDFGKGLHWNVYAAAGVHSCPVELDAALKRAEEGGPLPADSTVPSRARLLAGVELSWRYTPIFATGVGAELGYNANNYRETDLILEGREDPRGYSPVRAGLYLIQEFRYRQVAAHIIWGAYLFKRTGLTEDVGRTFQKIGVRYRFGRTGFYAGLDMRAHSFDRSYCLEWSAGCSF